MTRDIDSQRFLSDNLGPVAPDHHDTAGREAAADDLEATTPEGVHPAISGLRNEDGDLFYRDDLAAAGSRHAHRYG